jgi:hypothetical protein
LEYFILWEFSEDSNYALAIDKRSIAAIVFVVRGIMPVALSIGNYFWIQVGIKS